jgi:hypothetical protein
MRFAMKINGKQCRALQDIQMANPWLKKNPFLSMWLSSFNAAAGSMRGHALNQAKHQTMNAMTKATQDIFSAWMASFTPPSPPKSRRRRRQTAK